MRHLPPVCAPSLPGMAYIPGGGRADLSGWLSDPPVGVVCAGGCGVLRNAVFYLYLWRNKKAVITYKGAYGQTLGTATVTEQNANPFDGLSGAVGNMTNAIRESKQAKRAAAPYAQKYANMFWDRHTFFPGDVADGKALFKDKKAPSYELVLQLGQDKHVFRFDRLKKE